MTKNITFALTKRKCNIITKSYKGLLIPKQKTVEINPFLI